MAQKLDLSDSTKWVSGKYSGVDLSNSQEKVVVCVRDVALERGLFYQVGVFDGEILWGESKQYDMGQYPSVALITMDDKLYAVETHLSDSFNNCYYKFGKVVTAGKSILWGSTKPLGRGKNPKLAANDNGIVVAVKEDSWSFSDHLQLAIGKVDPVTMEIAWESDETIRDFSGVEPDVAINKRKIVIMCRSNGKIRFKVGNIRDNLSIGWVGASSEDKNPVSGRSPSIALNSHDSIVEVHQTWAGRGLSYYTGRVLGDSILWEETGNHDTGEYPCISLSDDGTVFEVHKSNWGNELFYRKMET